MRLTDAGWHAVLTGTPARWDAQALDCLGHWALRGLPLVVTRQALPSVDGMPEMIALGLPAPERWGRRRLALSVPLTAIQQADEFPLAASIAPLLAEPLRAPWQALCAALDAAAAAPTIPVSTNASGAPVRVCGSHGWQQLSGLACIRPQSDIDLLLSPADAATADALAALLHGAAFNALAGAPRLDGEFTFADGAAVAWREWAQWRSGQATRILVKRQYGTTLEDASSWRAPACSLSLSRKGRGSHSNGGGGASVFSRQHPCPLNPASA